jgi:hypothetical protein
MRKPIGGSAYKELNVRNLNTTAKLLELLSRVEMQPVDDLVDRLALGAEGDSDQVELLRRRSRPRPGLPRRGRL